MDDVGYNALHHAVSYHQPIDVRILVKKYGFDINEPTPDGWTCLMVTCNNGAYGLLNILLKGEWRLINKMNL